MNLLRSQSLVSSASHSSRRRRRWRRGRCACRSFEVQFFEQPLHDRVQPAGTDVLRRLVHLEGVIRQHLDGVGAEFERHAFGR